MKPASKTCSPAGACDAARRPLPWRMRPDLRRAEPTRVEDRWILRDEATGAFHRFSDQERTVLELLDGRRSAAEIIRRFARRHAGAKLEAERLAAIVAAFQQQRLVVAAGRGQGDLLRRQNDRLAEREQRARVLNPLSFRLPGIDPEPILRRLEPLVGGLFTVGAAVLVGLVALAAALLLLAEAEAVVARLPSLREFFAAGNWLWLGVALSLCKVVHELGHGIACRRLGGRCREIGVMFLVLSPCLYCDVSDVHLVPSRRKRAVVGLAGMYFELLLASLAVFVWWLSRPGLLQATCLNIVFVSSIRTVLVNANPLLRYDGYFVLSDLTNTPNLGKKAADQLRALAARLVLGVPRGAVAARPGAGWLLAYGIAAAVYRWVLFVGIAWFVWHLSEPYGLAIVGQLLACLVVYAALGEPVVGFVRWFVRSVGSKSQQGGSQVKPGRALVGMAATALLAAAALTIPLPNRTSCGFTLRAREATAIYVQTPGTIVATHVRAGQDVVAGQPLLELDNPELRRRAAELAVECARLRTRNAAARRAAFNDPAAESRRAADAEALAALERQAAAVAEELARLVIRAPRAGRFFPPERRPEPSPDDDRLGGWVGWAIDPGNVGATLVAGEPIGRLGDPARWEAVLAVPQESLAEVRTGQSATLQLEAFPQRAFRGTLDRIADSNLDFVPKSLSVKTGGELVTHADGQGRERPATAVYQASAPLDAADAGFVEGLRGRAWIRLEARTFGQRLYRLALQTWRFEL